MQSNPPPQRLTRAATATAAAHHATPVSAPPPTAAPVPTVAAGIAGGIAVTTLGGALLGWAAPRAPLRVPPGPPQHAATPQRLPVETATDAPAPRPVSAPTPAPPRVPKRAETGQPEPISPDRPRIFEPVEILDDPPELAPLDLTEPSTLTIADVKQRAASAATRAEHAEQLHAQHQDLAPRGRGVKAIKRAAAIHTANKTRGFVSKAQWRYFFDRGARDPRFRTWAHEKAHATTGGPKIRYRRLPAHARHTPGRD